jgi:hypothetical protein
MLTSKALSENMRRELKARVIPRLREMGFKGSVPHFRRVKGKRVDLLSFQFSSWGGQYAVNIAVCEMLDDGPLPKSIYSASMHGRRLTPSSDDADHWFDFDKPNVVLESLATRCATETLSLIETRGESYFSRGSRSLIINGRVTERA